MNLKPETGSEHVDWRLGMWEDDWSSRPKAIKEGCQLIQLGFVANFYIQCC